MRSHLTTLSTGAALVAFAAAQNGATAVPTTITVAPLDAGFFTIDGLTFSGTATVYSGKTLFSQSGNFWLLGPDGLQSGNGQIVNGDVTVSNGRFITNGVPVPVVATLAATPAATTTAAAVTTSSATGGVPAAINATTSATTITSTRSASVRSTAGSTSSPASSTGLANSAGERVATSYVVAAVSVFLAALVSL